MPCFAHPLAIERVSPATPAFDAAYASISPSGTCAIDDAVLTIAPPPAFAMCGIAYLLHRNTLVRFVRRTRSQASSAMSATEPSSPTGAMPALL